MLPLPRPLLLRPYLAHPAVLAMLALASPQSVLMVAFMFAAFFIGGFLNCLLLFDLTFSYLWLVVVAFSASWFTYARSSQAYAVETFSFLALYVSLGN